MVPTAQSWPTFSISLEENLHQIVLHVDKPVFLVRFRFQVGQVAIPEFARHDNHDSVPLRHFCLLTVVFNESDF